MLMAVKVFGRHISTFQGIQVGIGADDVRESLQRSPAEAEREKLT